MKFAVQFSATQRFFAKVSITPNCWRWLGGTNTKGYGRFTNERGAMVAAHRFSYEMVHGAIPVGLQLDHLCKNHWCVNPGHLEAVSARENLMRGATIAAANAAKTHCRHGHPFTHSNTYYTGANRRLCRTCIKLRNDATREYRRNYYKRRAHQTTSSSTE